MASAAKAGTATAAAAQRTSEVRRFDMSGDNDCFGSNSAFSLSDRDRSWGEA
jgi:hypothetical protein